MDVNNGVNFRDYTGIPNRKVDSVFSPNILLISCHNDDNDVVYKRIKRSIVRRSIL